MALFWPDLLLFVTLFVLFGSVLAFTRITHTHKVYLAFHFNIMLWPLGQFMLGTTDVPSFQEAYVKLSFSAVSLLGPGWLFFVLFLTGRSDMLNIRKALLYLLPSLACIAGVVWNPGQLFMSPLGSSYLDRTYGPFFWLVVVIQFVYFIIALLIMFHALKTVTSINKRKQLAIVVFGIFVLTGFAVIDLLLNVLLAPWLPIMPGLTSLGILLSDCCFVFAIFRYSMFDILSTAQRDILSHMEMGIIVLDEEGKVLEVNRGAGSFVRTGKGEVFEMEKFLSALQQQGDIQEFLYKYRHHSQERIQTEVTLNDPIPRHVTIQIFPVIDRNTLIGRIIVFHDVTEFRKLVDEMNRKNEALHERNLELITIQEELFRVNQKLEQMAITDSLTGCYNRRYLMQQLEHEVLLNMRYRIPFSVFLFDIDHFKQINDQYGHLIGDEVIRRTAETVRDKLRRTDTLARYGGEEFTVYLPHTNREQAILLADRIKTAVSQNVMEAGTEKVRVTISMGVVSEDGEDLQFDDPKEYLREVFARADAALYQAKNQGRNCVIHAPSRQPSGSDG